MFHIPLPWWIPLRWLQQELGDLQGDSGMDVNPEDGSETWRAEQEEDNCRNSHPSRDTGNASVWCGSWGGPSRPCRTARPRSEPSRMRTGRRNEGRLRSGCIRPETRQRDMTRWTHLLDYCSVTFLLTLFLVWVCPMRIRALEEMMERQKLIRMTERSERMYLQEEEKIQLQFKRYQWLMMLYKLPDDCVSSCQQASKCFVHLGKEYIL